MHLDHVMPRALEHLLGPEWKRRLHETVRTFMAGTTPGELRRAEVRARRSAAAAEANKKRWAA
ncbi:MAG TPA: hypothetical protein VGN96_02400, partial [Roseococcus sp.]|nr:hypothetical protein [Roseococcus sp.]